MIGTSKIDEIHELSIEVPSEGELPIVKRNIFLILDANEIRVKMMTMGYCGRDKSTVTGQKTAVPGRIGHEGAGIIVEKGAEVEHLYVGQNIVVFPFIRKHNIGYDWPDGGKGIFSNYAVIPSEAVHPINKGDISDEDWLTFSMIEPFAGVSRALKRGEITKRDLLIVLGAGPMGCEQVILAKYLNPSIKVILIDTSKEKIKSTKQINIPADYLIHLDTIENIEKKIFDIFSKYINVLIVHSNPFKLSIKQAFQMAPDNSTLLFFSGVYDWKEKDNEELGFVINPKNLHYEEYDENNPETVVYSNKRIKIIGSRGFTRDDFNYSAELIISQKINPLSLITKVVKFDDNILENLKIEGEIETNIKVLMSPYDDFLNVL